MGGILFSPTSSSISGGSVHCVIIVCFKLCDQSFYLFNVCSLLAFTLSRCLLVFTWQLACIIFACLLGLHRMIEAFLTCLPRLSRSLLAVCFYEECRWHEPSFGFRWLRIHSLLPERSKNSRKFLDFVCLFFVSIPKKSGENFDLTCKNIPIRPIWLLERV